MLTFYSCMGAIREEDGVGRGQGARLYLVSTEGPCLSLQRSLDQARSQQRREGRGRIAHGRQRLVLRPQAGWKLTDRSTLFSPPSALNRKVWQHQQAGSRRAVPSERTQSIHLTPGPASHTCLLYFCLLWPLCQQPPVCQTS